MYVEGNGRSRRESSWIFWPAELSKTLTAMASKNMVRCCPHFKPSGTTKVCSLHFYESDIKKGIGGNVNNNVNNLH